MEAEVEVKKKMVTMTFISNTFNWSAVSICELYRARWGIEVFFKEIKQTLQLADFMGYNKNAVRWQVVERASGLSAAAFCGMAQ